MLGKRSSSLLNCLSNELSCSINVLDSVLLEKCLDMKRLQFVNDALLSACVFVVIVPHMTHIQGEHMFTTSQRKRSYLPGQ